MHAASGGQFDTRVLPAAERRWRGVVARAKRAREGLVRLVPGAERDVRHRLGGARQQRCRPLEPEPSRQLESRLTDHSAKDAVEMKRGDRCIRRETLEIERFVEALRNALDRALHDLRVVRPCGWLHQD
jgi:hypothetical protein